MTMLRFNFLSSLVLALGALAQSQPVDTDMNAVAQAAGKLYFGSASDNVPEFPNALYMSTLAVTTTFGQVTPANAMKWNLTEPEPGNFTFAGGDELVNFAKANGQLIRGHNFVWHNQLPDWVTSSNFTADEATMVIQRHISTLGGRYSGELYAWDVLNEALNEDGTLRQDVWFNALGFDYIPLAFREARKADSVAKLYYNDFNIEGVNPTKTAAAVNLIQTLQQMGVEVNGVGFQCHFEVGGVPSTLQENIEMFTALGVEVAITELDLRLTLPPSEADLAQQVTDYNNVISSCANVEGCVGVTVWDYTDLFSWIPGAFPGMGMATPFDENISPKPDIINAIKTGFSSPTPQN